MQYIDLKRTLIKYGIPIDLLILCKYIPRIIEIIHVCNIITLIDKLLTMVNMALFRLYLLSGGKLYESKRQFRKKCKGSCY